MSDLLLRYDKEKEYVFIDCETFNLCLNSCHNLPWQVSMIKAKGDKKLDDKDFYIKWDTHLKISADAARITRFSQNTLDKKGLTPKEVIPTIIHWLDNADYIVGHNILGFDIYLIRDLYHHVGKDYTHLISKIIDTNAVARGIKYEMPYSEEDDLTEYQYRVISTRKRGVKTNLQHLGKEFEIEHDYEKLHNALVDLELNLKVWNKLKWQIEL
tara:strand:+ start:344 stop:982 length:639 start_codon:yes stop_codon:yes gene_type:complete